MGAVFGFTGAPDEKLAETMAAELVHRGSHVVSKDANPGGSVCLRSPHQTGKIGSILPELHCFPEWDLTIALCGWLTGIDDPQLERAAQTDNESTSLTFFRHLAKRYRSEGPNVVRWLRGAFVLVIRDGQSLHLSRDGAGNRTVFYGRAGDRWLFGIEPKSITVAPAFSKRIRPAGVAQYLACSFVPGNGTMLEDLWEAPAGHIVTLQLGCEPRLTRWFDFEAEEHHAEEYAAVDTTSQLNGDASIVKAFRDELARAVAERIPKNEPIGVFLSGGLDSSVITAELARQVGGHNVKTWAIHFGPNYPNELEYARAVADRCGTAHREVLIQPRDFLPRLRQMIWHLDDPIGDPITQPNYELAAYVSDEVRFVFNGEGGDPCFGGPKNIPMMLHHWYGGVDREPNFRERRYLESYRRAWDEIEFLLSDDVRAQIDVERDLEGIFKPYLQADRPRLFLNRLTAINIREKGAHLIQPKVERMLAAHRLTPLAPLFDERLIRFSFTMPAKFKLHQGVEKVVLKQAYQNDLPREVIERPKSGMRVPVHYWFQSELKRYVRRILGRRATQQAGLFNAERMQQLISYNLEEGRGRYGLRLWMLTTFEIWRRMIIEGESV